MVAFSPLADVRESFARLKAAADGAIAQAPPTTWRVRLDPESNSIAIVMQHLAGNMRSRWTDFLTTDGEKSDRRRDEEFEDPPGVATSTGIAGVASLDDATVAADRVQLLAAWEEGWRLLFSGVESLAPEDLSRTITIRGEPHTVHQAILRQLTHSAYHVGQIVQLAKHHAGPGWRTLSVPRGASETHTAAMRAKFGERR